MNEWIDINLPFNFTPGFPEKYSPPDVSDEIHKRLGYSSQDLKEMSKGFIDLPTAKQIEINDILRELHSDSESYIEKSLQHIDPWIGKMALYRERSREFDDALRSHPARAEYDKGWKERLAAFDTENKKKSFTGRGLNKPGTIIETKQSSGEKKQFLIGDINSAAGTCGCCSEIQSSDIVLRYMIVWEKE